jgi:phage baseplate assembly protein W
MELYIKTIGDPNYISTEVQTNDDVQQLITQIETVLFTNKGEVLGDVDFGCSLNDLLYTLNANEFAIKGEIDRQISKYCPLATEYDTEVDIVFVRGEVRDEAYIDITIDNTFVISVTP